MKNYLKYVFVFLWFMMIMNPIHSQVKHSHDIVLGFLQLKDEFGLGLVFNGGQLEYRYGLQWKINEQEIQYQPKLGLGLAFSRGLMGIQTHIAPVNVTWTTPFFERDGHVIKGGANLITDYNHQFYELHDGPIFWNTEIGVSPIICYGYQFDNKRINVRLQNSVIGFTSHRPGYDPYIWSFTWKDFVIYPNQDLKFGSFNHYNHTKVSLGFVPNISRKHAFAYEFDYLGFFYENRFYRINHNLVWRVSL